MASLLECLFKLPEGQLLAHTLTAARHHLEDLAHTQVGHWVPFEVRLNLSSTLLHGDSDANAQIREFGAWLRAQGWDWRVLMGGPLSAPRLRVKCRAAQHESGSK